ASELDLIKTEHARDGHVLYELAKAHARAGRADETLALLEAAEENGFRADDLYVMRAGLNYRRSEGRKAAADLLKALHVRMSSDPVNGPVGLLEEVYPDGLAHLAKSTAFNSLQVREKLAIGRDLAGRHKTLLVGVQLLRQLAGEAKDDYPLLQDIRSSL